MASRRRSIPFELPLFLDLTQPFLVQAMGIVRRAEDFTQFAFTLRCSEPDKDEPEGTGGAAGFSSFAAEAPSRGNRCRRGRFRARMSGVGPSARAFAWMFQAVA